MSASAGNTPRSRGNGLFVKGDFAAAAAAYSEGITDSIPKAGSPDADELATLLSNRAACRLELGQPDLAASDCRACLQLQPLNAKAHYRLARALPPDHEAAAPAIAAAVVLLGPSGCTPAVLETYANIHRATAAAAAAAASATGCDLPAGGPARPLLLVPLPEDPAQVAVASNWKEVDSALWRGTRLVVLRPGLYTTQVMAPEGRRQPYTLLGLGSVELRPPPFGGGHAVWVTEHHPPVTLARVRLAGNGRGAAACASGAGARLSMLECLVEDYGEVGLLVCQHGRAWLESCTFTRTAAQAIEVREGGELEASRLTITECMQGVSAYGGAKSVSLRDCVVTKSVREGVLAAGTYTNAPTEAQGAGRGPARSESARAATEAATAWGRRHGTQLSVTLSRCTISHSRQFGISADSGASVVAVGCRLEGNDPYGVFVKGGTDVTLAGCQVVFSGAVSKCDWFSRTAVLPGHARGHVPKLPPTRQSGVQVGTNYSGSVTVLGCAFGGREDLALVEEMKPTSTAAGGAAVGAMVRRMGMYSKPVSSERNSFHDGVTSAAGLPGLETLVQRLPAWLLQGGGGAAAAGTDGTKVSESGRSRRPAAPAALLQRTSHTFPKSSWAPTVPEFYAIGNTLGYDVTGGLLTGTGHSGASALASARASVSAAAGAAACTETPATVRVLLGACGDIRNLLATAHAVLGSEAATTADDGGATAAAAAAGTAASASGATQAAAAGREARAGPGRRRLVFTLNDGNLAMLARNAVMLHMSAELEAPPEAVLAVWASHGLTARQAELLTASLTALAHAPWPEWLSAHSGITSDDSDPLPSPPRGGDGGGGGRAHGASPGGGVCEGGSSSGDKSAEAEVAEAERALRAAFAAWASCKLTLSELLAQREERLGGEVAAGRLRGTAVDLTMEALQAQAQVGKAADKLRGEVVEYVRTGSLRPPEGDSKAAGGRLAAAGATRLVASNPTFLLAPELQYTVYFSSSIFRAVPLGPGRTAAERLLATLAPQLTTAARALRSGAMGVRLVHGDILAAMLDAAGASSSSFSSPSSSSAAAATAAGGAIAIGDDAVRMSSAASAPAPPAPARSQAPAPQDMASFDFIDCSNVADYVSVQALVQAAAPLLARHAAARLRAESIVVFGAEARKAGAGAARDLAPAAFVESQLGVSLPAFQELTGLCFLGGSANLGRQSGVRMEWAPAVAPAAAQDYSARLGDGGAARGGVGFGSDGATWLTGPRLLLDLLPAAKRLLTPGPGTGTPPACSPLALVHLLTLRAPAAAEPVVRALARADPSGVAGLFNWELSLHAALQAAATTVRRTPPAVRRVKYDARPGWELVGHEGSPLLLAFSEEPLPRGPLEAAPSAGGGPVKQLVSAFTWDEDLAVAEVLLAESVVRQYGSWRVTLCALEDSGLVAVGASARLASLPTAPAAPVRWRRLVHEPALDLGSMALLDAVGDRTQPAAAASSSPLAAAVQRERQPWRGALHEWSDGAGRAGVTMDVLAPEPLAAGDEVAVLPSVEGGELVVLVERRGASASGGSGGGSKGKSKKGGGKAAAQAEAEAEAEVVLRLRLPVLPGGVYGKPESAKLSRKLGLLSARVAVLDRV